MKKQNFVSITSLVAVFMVFAPVFMYAQGGNQAQQQDRDRVQDPTTHDGDEPEQDRDQIRDQDRDRLQDPAVGYTSGYYGGDINFSETAGTATQLRTMLQQRSGEASTSQEQEREQLRFTTENENRVYLGAYAFMSARALLGASGDTLARIAGQVAASTTEALHAEERIQNRSVFTRFWAGAPDDVVALLARVSEENRARLEIMRQTLNSCPCDEETRTILREQLRLMQEEQVRLSQVAYAQGTVIGVFTRMFGGLFR